jgi:hypothetical protein
MDYTGVGHGVYDYIARNVRKGQECRHCGGVGKLFDHDSETECLPCKGRGRIFPEVTLRPVSITSGSKSNINDSGTWTVPKRELAGVLQPFLPAPEKDKDGKEVRRPNDRFRIGSRVAFSDILQRELENFKVKIKAETGNESFEAWRERDHDDMVLALLIALWVAEQGKAQLWVR